MRDIALSLAGRLAMSVTVLSVAIIPASTSSPASITRGMLSPVSAAVSSADARPVRVPSTGTRSPGLTSTRSPTFTSAGSTGICSPWRTTTAWSGLKAMSDVILLRARPTA